MSKATAHVPHGEYLGLRRKQLTAELLQREPDLMREFLHVIEAQERQRETLAPGALDYLQVRQPFDAISMHLDRVGTFMPDSELVDAVLSGGFARGEKRGRAALRESIEYHTTRSNKLVRRSSDGLIGRAEWGDSKSQSQS